MPLILTRHSGISLIELILAITMLAGALAAFSLGFLKASQNIANSRQRWVATHIASTQIASLKSQPYGFLNTTSPTYFPVSNPKCDCTLLDFTVLPSSTSQVAGTIFNEYSCVNYVGRSLNAWQAQCTNSPTDPGYKNIMVRVYWTNGSNTLMTTQESMSTQY